MSTFRSRTLVPLLAAVLGALSPATYAGQGAPAVPAPADATPPAAAPPVLKPVAGPSRQLAELAERYYEEEARFDPIGATYSGDNRFDDVLPMTIMPAVRARRFAMLHDVRDSLGKIDRSKLAGTDLTSFDCLAYEVNTELRFESLKDHLLPMNQLDSLPVELANFGSGEGSQPIATVEQYNKYLKRISALPQWTDAAIANMRTGMKQGIVLPKALVLALIPQIKALAEAAPEKSAFTAPLRKLPAAFTPGEQARMKGGYLDAVRTRVLPSVRKLARFLETEYLPAARETAGWGALPDGANWYRVWVADTVYSAEGGRLTKPKRPFASVA